MAGMDQAIKDFLLPRMYHHPRIMRIMGDAERVVGELFQHYINNPEDLPLEWRSGLAEDAEARARLIVDFIAGMTDRYAQQEYRRLFLPSVEP